MSPEIMIGIFKLRENTHYNLRRTSQFLVDPIHSVFNGSEWASYLGPKIWEQIPFKIKNINSLVEFKKEIRKWKAANDPCNLQSLHTRFRFCLKPIRKYLSLKNRIIQRTVNWFTNQIKLIYWPLCDAGSYWRVFRNGV